MGLCSGWGCVGVAALGVMVAWMAVRPYRLGRYDSRRPLWAWAVPRCKAVHPRFAVRCERIRRHRGLHWASHDHEGARARSAW